MGWCEIINERTRERTVYGRDPLADDAPKGQIAREIDEFEDFTGARTLVGRDEFRASGV